jgi:hypothetical protein
MLGVEAWTTIRFLNAQGEGIRAICRQLGVSRTAVRHALRSEEPPRCQRPARPNLQLAPFEAQIHSWYLGQHLIGSRILRELRKRGYLGGPTALYTYLKGLRTAVPSSKVSSPVFPRCPFFKSRSSRGHINLGRCSTLLVRTGRGRSLTRHPMRLHGGFRWMSVTADAGRDSRRWSQLPPPPSRRAARARH